MAMIIVRIYTSFFGLLFWLTAYSQTPDLIGIDNALTSNFKTMVASDQNLNFDSLSNSFKKQLVGQLTNSITFYQSLDSLSKYLKIINSSDKQIKFYSWDDIGGGTWHNINCLAQFKSDKGCIIVQQLNTENEEDIADFTDSGIYEVNDIFINETKYYLTFAWGTHGGGHQHKIAQIFSISSDKLVKCRSCFAENNDLIIQYPRAGKANLVFDSKTNIISFNEYKFDEIDGIYTPTGRIITLELVNGVFVTK